MIGQEKAALIADLRRLVAQAERLVASERNAELMFKYELWLGELRASLRRLRNQAVES